MILFPCDFRVISLAFWTVSNPYRVAWGILIWNLIGPNVAICILLLWCIPVPARRRPGYFSVLAVLLASSFVVSWRSLRSRSHPGRALRRCRPPVAPFSALAGVASARHARRSFAGGRRTAESPPASPKGHVCGFATLHVQTMRPGPLWYFPASFPGAAKALAFAKYSAAAGRAWRHVSRQVLAAAVPQAFYSPPKRGSLDPPGGRPASGGRLSLRSTAAALLAASAGATSLSPRL